MKKNTIIVLTMSAILLITQFARCDANTPAIPKDANTVIMTLDSNELTLAQVNSLAANPDLNMINNVADYWLNTQLLYEEAIKRGLDKDSAAKFQAEMNYKKAFASALVEQAQKEATVTEEEMKKYYEDNKAADPRLKDPTYLSYSHITADTPEKAEEIRKKIEEGAEINELAKTESKAADAQKGGRAAKVREETVRTRFGQEFLDALLNASEGQIIGPIKNKDGKYEVARHEGKRASRLLEFNEVKDQIKSQLENQKKKDAVQNLINGLQDKAKSRYKKADFITENKNDEKEKNSEK
ncbi:MAG: Foldase protein PrsA 2 precursor [Planctomycetes bacterium ADurb.Bin401]|nr:MAG: Foldase protein PrsA 2 precursor [Planctomycetes bacterium ADurb.Bin401]